MEYIKLQIGCIIVLIYIAFIYYRGIIRDKVDHKINVFDAILIISAINIVFDGITAYTINNLDSIPDIVNRIFQAIFLISLDCVIFFNFINIIHSAGVKPKKFIFKFIVYAPFIICMIVLMIFISRLHFIRNEISNYAIGISYYISFFLVFLYTLSSLAIFARRFKYIKSGKRMTIITYTVVLLATTFYQLIIPYSLITSVAVTVLVIGLYLNQEDPSLAKLTKYHNEMVFGFATLIESKDLNTGDHVKRTTQYVKMLAKELKKKGYYRNELTNDYIENLGLAAPMHDIGKIAIPDAVLQKQDKLTKEEYEIIKSHTIKGGEIIRNSFGHMDKDYLDIAYNIAYCHHERWDGKGYPNNLVGIEIPLCARIMAIADVFDAISEKRCYRKALPLSECFDIIKKGRGNHFEPLLVDVFLSIKQQVIDVYTNVKHS